MNDEPMLPRCYLASRSPARAALLRVAGYEVIQDPISIDEDIPHTDPVSMTRELSQMKMRAWMDAHTDSVHTIGPESFVLTADTLVHLQGRILGKPSDRTRAEEMLQTLSGMTHEVVSAFTIAFRVQDDFVYQTVHDVSTVQFFDLSEREVEWYLQTEEWVNAAGAYRIQGRGLQLISSLQGSYFTIVGLPITSISGIVRVQMHD